MGIYRLLLSVLVVFFHTTTLLGTVGYSAVFGFYIISGYCISMVLDQKYQGGVWKFWLNRGLKLIPSYLAVLGCSIVVMNVFTDEAMFVASLSTYSLRDILNEVLLGYLTPRSAALLLNGFPTIIAQAWTHSVQIFFYITAPFVCSIYKRKEKIYWLLGAITLVFPIATALLKLDFPTYRYRSVFGSYWIFFIGSTLYFKRDSIPKIKNSSKYFIVLAITYVLMFSVGMDKAVLSETKIYISVLIEVLMLIMASQMTYNNVKMDKGCSVLSMGIYLTHMLARALAVVIINNNKYLSMVFDGTQAWMIVIPVLVISVILAIVLYVCVDRPVEKIRKKVITGVVDRRREKDEF